MSNQNSHMCLIIWLLCIFLSQGCSPNIRYLEYTSERYEPTQHVEVLQAKPPSRDFIELGVISVPAKIAPIDKGSRNPIDHLVEKAKSIGADAVLILGERSSGGVVLMPAGNTYIAVPTTGKIEAIAIRYK